MSSGNGGRPGPARGSQRAKSAASAAASRASTGAAAAAGSARRRRTLWPILGSIVLVGVLFLAVFPTRTYLRQRNTISEGQKRLEVIEEQNAKLAARVRALDTDAEIERLAREQYNLVRPGEESYAILPAPSPTIMVPDAWPVGPLVEKIIGRPASDDQAGSDDDDGPAKSDPATTTTTARAGSGKSTTSTTA